MTRHIDAHTLLTLALGLLIVAAPATAQEAVRTPLTLASGRVTINGSSNVHEWTAQSTTVRLTRVKVAANTNAAALWDQIVVPGTLEAFEIAIPAATLSSPKDGLDKNMHKALKVKEFADITFRLLRLEPGAATGTFKGVGMLTIAGVEREVGLTLKTVRKDASFVVSGAVGLLMTDFGIEPPKAMLGMLKTDPKVTIVFETVLASGEPLTDSGDEADDPKPSETPKRADTAEQEAIKSSWTKGRPLSMQYFRPVDKRGINVFETTKTPGADFNGFKIDFNAAFTSQVQSLDHRNTALPNVVNGTDANKLADIGFGFNNSTANLALHAQLAPGIRVALTSYLSSRHHNETWVKDGYIQMDESPIDFVPLKALMQIVTLRVGHMEINYGDAHFRRSDNGNALYNPFVGNYILDSFTTEIGGEVYLKAANVVAMGAIMGGEIRGTVLTPEQRGPSFIGKLGYDRQVNPDLRVRLTGSMYKTNRAVSNTLFSGDRAGSRFYFVLENTLATETAQKDSGLINPGFKNRVSALQVNPFVKFRGLEVFGVLERAEGRASTEAADRTWNQYAIDAVYRFAPAERFFAGVRYNKAAGALAGITGDVGAERWEMGGGWFILPGLLAKAEYVKQTFTGYPPTHIRNGGKFNGMMLEGIVAF